MTKTAKKEKPVTLYVTGLRPAKSKHIAKATQTPIEQPELVLQHGTFFWPSLSASLPLWLNPMDSGCCVG